MTHFLTSETGAVTVDWVVLTAGLVGLGLATMAVVSSGVEDLSGDVDRELVGHVIKTSFGPDYTPFAESTYANFRDLHLATDEQGDYNVSDATMVSSELNWRNSAQGFIDAGSINNARSLMDRARGIEEAAFQRGVTLSSDGPTYAELTAAYEAEFGT